jgi:16S rRNA (guanine966-N2)-methyltransferase
MRIISGTFRSRTLEAPKGDKTRPTSDRARETLFNILANIADLEDAAVLDLFAGSGAFAFEAMSRGASSATCVDSSAEAIAAVKLNASKLGVNPTSFRLDVYKWLESTDGQYDIIFADPPYDDPNLPEILVKSIFSSRLLMDDSIVIIEHRAGSKLVIPSDVTVVRDRSAGEAQFTFLQRRGGETENSHLPGNVRSDNEWAS